MKCNAERRRQVGDLLKSGLTVLEITKELKCAASYVRGIKKNLTNGLSVEAPLPRIDRGSTSWRPSRVQDSQVSVVTESDGSLEITVPLDPAEEKLRKKRDAVRKCRSKKGLTDLDAVSRVGKHMILSCCTRQEQTPEEVSTARKNFLSTSLKILALDIVSAFPEVNMYEFDEILRKVSQ